MEKVKKGIVAKISADRIVTVQPPDGGPFPYKIPERYFECKIVIGMKVDIVTSKDGTDMKVVASPRVMPKRKEVKSYKGVIVSVADDDGDVHLFLENGNECMLSKEFFECEIKTEQEVSVVLLKDGEETDLKVIARPKVVPSFSEVKTLLDHVIDEHFQEGDGERHEKLRVVEAKPTLIEQAEVDDRISCIEDFKRLVKNKSSERILH